MEEPAQEQGRAPTAVSSWTETTGRPWPLELAPIVCVGKWGSIAYSILVDVHSKSTFFNWADGDGL